MGRFASESGGTEFKQAPAGSHVARCFRIIDLGTQISDYQGVVNHKNQILVSWELPNELMEDGKPFIVSSFYTNSLNKKANLRADLISWRGRDFTEDELAKFDLESIIGAPCILSVVLNTKGKAVVEGVMKLAKGMVCQEAVNPKMAFWLDDFDLDKYESLSNGIKQIIAKSPEYQAAVEAEFRKENVVDESFETEVVKDTADDFQDIPF